MANTSDVQDLILAVDDDCDLLELLRRALEGDGYQVITASNATHALELTSRQQPALIIADLMLPYVDGEAFLDLYRNQWPDSRSGVILLTASAQREDVARRMGIHATLPKPFSLDELRGLVREVLAV